ncbi:hypothetical protein PthBH41_35400 [Parageobacillus thermoglucosidasius]|nr:hypothetical protein PthBH41_35400 [Parageobacillus thermoglucosidasius]GAJ43482.1 hypothetical protein GT2_10_00430 [Parageobacillus thermoglucosidasius NBRC 107763]
MKLLVISNGSWYVVVLGNEPNRERRISRRYSKCAFGLDIPVTASVPTILSSQRARTESWLPIKLPVQKLKI